MPGLKRAGAVQEAIPAPPASVTLLFETWAVLCLSVAVRLASSWRWGFLRRTRSTPASPSVHPKKRSKEEDTKSAGGTKRRGEQRGGKAGTGLVGEWEEKTEENRESEAKKGQLEERHKSPIQQDLLQSLGHSFLLAHVSLKLSLGPATFLSGPKTELFSGWIWQMRVISFLPGTVSGRSTAA